MQNVSWCRCQIDAIVASDPFLKWDSSDLISCRPSWHSPAIYSMKYATGFFFFDKYISNLLQLLFGHLSAYKCGLMRRDERWRHGRRRCSTRRHQSHRYSTRIGSVVLSKRLSELIDNRPRLVESWFITWSSSTRIEFINNNSNDIITMYQSIIDIIMVYQSINDISRIESMIMIMIIMMRLCRCYCSNHCC